MVQITDEEKEILGRWVPGVDLLKLKIRAGPIADWACFLFGAQAITIGHTIFVSSKSWIMQYPAAHPVRLALLVHELFHVKQEADKWLPRYLIQCIIIALCLILKAMITKRWFTPSKLAHFIAKHHPYEKPAYRLEEEFFSKYWTEEESLKWK